MTTTTTGASNMKATTEQIERVRAAIAPFDTPTTREAYATGNYPRSEATKDVDKRYRWDLANAAGWQLICGLYDEGLTDVHVDTILRSVVAPLTEEN